MNHLNQTIVQDHFKKWTASYSLEDHFIIQIKQLEMKGKSLLNKFHPNF